MRSLRQVDLVQNASRASALLHPLRLRILESLYKPDSAAGLARRLHLPRQKVNYHVRELARAHFLTRAGRRRKRNMTEQLYVATARGYVLSPEILGRLGANPGRVEDALSAGYLLALTAQAQTELGRASREAATQGKRFSTLSLNTELRFESAEQRSEFAQALQQAVVDVVGRHASPFTGRDATPGTGRPYRLILACYPIPSMLNPQSGEDP